MYCLTKIIQKERKKLLEITEKPIFLKMAGSLPAKNKEGKKIEILKLRDHMEKNYERV